MRVRRLPGICAIAICAVLVPALVTGQELATADGVSRPSARWPLISGPLDGNGRAFQPGVVLPRLTSVDSSRGRRTLIGAVIGGVAAGTALAVGHRVSYGECDDGEAHIPCEAMYGLMFGIGFVPGALAGGLIGARR